MKNWPKKYYYSFYLFCFGLFWASATLINEGINPGGAIVEMWSVLFSYSIIGGVLGYIIGFLVDMFKKK